MQSATPKKLLPSVWPLSISLATTLEISVDFFSSPYLDVSVQEVPLIYLCIQYMIYRLHLYGLLHSDICGSQFAYNLPQLFAVNHVLLRLPVPRHPPCALISFTICNWVLFKNTCSFTRLDLFLKKSCRFTWLYFLMFLIFNFQDAFSILFQEQKLIDNFFFIY